MLVFLLIVGLGPLLWLPSRDHAHPGHPADPMALWPNGIDLSNLADAWNRVHIDRYFFNTLAHRVRVVARPDRGRDDRRLCAVGPASARMRRSSRRSCMATLFVPAVVLLVPLYLTVLDPPSCTGALINSFWAVWLPAGASAFNVILVKRFFDNLPREIFEAARVDGAGPFRLFWSIVLPMSQADPRRGLGVRGHRDLEGLPVAAAGAARPGHPAAVGAPADPGADDRAGRVPRRAGASRRSSRS